MVPRFQQLVRQVEAERVRNSRKNIHQTWGPLLTHDSKTLWTSFMNGS